MANMLMVDQLRSRRVQIRRSMLGLSQLTGMSRPYLSSVLTPTSQIDPRVSTVESIAAGLDAEWVLVPKHLMPEVLRLLAGKVIALDDIPSAMERLLG